MTDSALEPHTDIQSPPSLAARMKASLLGGLVATLAAPAFWLLLVLVQPSGFWTNPADVLIAIPAIWLFAGVVVVPASLCLGPMLLAFTSRRHRPQLVTSVAGALAGAAIMYILPVAAGSPDHSFSVGLSAFGAATAALGAFVAARSIRRSQLLGRSENAA